MGSEYDTREQKKFV